MSEKHLTELPWKTLTVRKQIKDGEVTKSLVAFAKLGDDDTSGRVKCLDRLVIVADALKKEQKDAEVTTYLDDLIKEAKKTKAVLASAKKPEVEPEAEDGDEAEIEEFRKNYKGKLVGALAQVKSREPGDSPTPGPQLQFMVYNAGKQSSLILAPKVGGGATKLLLALSGGVAGGKYLVGECIFEKNKYTFVVPSLMGGLAGSLSRAILAQTGTKYPIRVRTASGEEEPEEAESAADSPAAPGDGTATSDPAAAWKSLKTALYPDIKKALEANSPNRTDILTLVGQATKFEQAGAFDSAIEAFNRLRPLLGGTASPAATPPSDAPAAQYQRRMSGLNVALEAALRDQRGDTGKLRAVAAFAQEKAAAGNYDSALKAAVALEKLLSEAAAPAAGKETDFSKVQFEKVHLEWDAAKQQVQTRLDKLQTAILEDDEDPEASAAVKKLGLVLGRFNEGLGDTMDALRNSETKEDRATAAKKAMGIADHYLAYVDSGPLVAHVESNPFEIAVEVASSLSPLLVKLKTDLNPLVV